MENKVEFPIKLETRKEYTSEEIQQYGLIPWAKSSRKVTQLIKEDFFGENKMKARIEGIGVRTRYFVKGQGIINYVNHVTQKKWNQKK